MEKLTQTTLLITLGLQLIVWIGMVVSWRLMISELEDISKDTRKEYESWKSKKRDN